jgi:formylglycine-generating enzyme required for sulfatase activity
MVTMWLIHILLSDVMVWLDIGSYVRRSNDFFGGQASSGGTLSPVKQSIPTGQRLRRHLAPISVCLLAAILASVGCNRAKNSPAPQSPTPAVSYGKTFTNSLGMDFVRIEPGEFFMGSPANQEGHASNETQHKVKITRPFMLGITTVTQRQWIELMGNNPSLTKGDDLPVTRVSWDDAVQFCRKLNSQEGKTGYRLPTEAQWEYACRAGTTTQYNTGDGEQALNDAGWYAGNSGHKTHSVGQKAANAWGLYDMHGNVWEWCNDYYGPPLAADAVDPAGPAQGDANPSRIERGGSWDSTPRYCRAACRVMGTPSFRGGKEGFRCLLEVP